MQRSIALVSLFILAAVSLAVAASAADPRTLEGSFLWTRDDGESTGDLSAVLTPEGDDAWKVAFHFVWEGEPHIYLGQASGSLVSGPFEGSAESDGDRKMSFHFRGEFEDGNFRGEHSFVKDDGSLEKSGQLTLSHPE